MLDRARRRSTSGDDRHWVEVQGRRLSHTMGSTRGAALIASPASVTVLARSCAVADARAKVLMVVGREKGATLARRRGLDALMHLRDDEGKAGAWESGDFFPDEPAAIASAGER